jgi:integrase/recombinase XerD
MRAVVFPARKSSAAFLWPVFTRIPNLSHFSRHTVASQMVNHGARFKEVADVLGHQPSQTTGINTKLDLDAMAAVALPWAGGAL